jgi:hypothetical protein
MAWAFRAPLHRRHRRQHRLNNGALVTLLSVYGARTSFYAPKNCKKIN